MSVIVVVPGKFLEHFEGTSAGQDDLANEGPEGKRLAEIAEDAVHRSSGHGSYAIFTFELPEDQGALDYLAEMGDFVAGCVDDDPPQKHAGKLVVSRCEKAGASTQRWTRR